MTTAISFKRGEAKSILFNITRSGSPITQCTLMFQVKININESKTVIKKFDYDFNKADSANGNYTLILKVSDTAELVPGDYVAELRTVITAGTDVDKSYTIPVIVEAAVISG